MDAPKTDRLEKNTGRRGANALLDSVPDAATGTVAAVVAVGEDIRLDVAAIVSALRAGPSAPWFFY